MAADPFARFNCVDCKVGTDEIGEYYMVHDHVWSASRLGMFDGMLCIGCLEHRLGRKLVAADFTDASLNHGLYILQSGRLRDRLGRLP